MGVISISAKACGAKSRNLGCQVSGSVLTKKKSLADVPMLGDPFDYLNSCSILFL